MRKELLDKLDEFSRETLEAEIALRACDVGEEYHGGTKKLTKEKQSSISPEDLALIERLQRDLGTKVSILRKKTLPNKGKLVIDFYSNEDLNEVLARLMS